MKKVSKLSLVMLLAFVVILAGCGNNNNNANNGGKNASASTAPSAGASAAPATDSGAPAASDVKVGMVTDVGGVNDKSFNQSAWEALQALEKEKGVKVQYLQSKSNADYEPNLSQFVRDKYSLTWGIGFDLGDALKKVADANPDSKLAIIDSVVDAPNVESVTFAENEGSFLVGVVAGLTTKTNKVGFIGGMESPVIKRFEVGFKAGVQAVNPSATVKVMYAGAYDKPDIGKSIAATLYDAGNDIIFPAAGATGNGVFNEAKARNKAGGSTKLWVIGVDKDQSLEFGDDVTLTSMMKRVDVAVKNVSQQVIDGTFKGGTTTVLGLKDDGVGLPETSKANVSEDILKKVDEYKQKIVDGSITVPTE
ncbi:BMP family ABC transporter substrate-binding protein [Paenibacillus spiritus]|uniref:BMP family ABC transporter substrate-binding protein n=1 Tax=Paenibacillus spiritus TaxID=2496557 RepID=A0A5J5GKC7_9BACL|nr:MULTISPECIES: BMP family ABC transporter substrate-binding protein [Paenibacillus]KAA9008477.1 BMP family ABC transporter substrate-binding protein [Paenibacillus spiritus]